MDAAIATAQQVADAVRDAMWKDDRASQSLGIEVLAVGPGSATLRMVVRADMLNSHRICHGGLMTTLADSHFICFPYETRRTGIYDIELRDQNGRRLLAFRGRSMTLLGTHIVPTLRSTRGD